MTDEEILIKAIEKAEESGFKYYWQYISKDEKVLRNMHIYEINGYYATIFSHEFAKAFFGEEEVDDMGRNSDESWEEYWKDSGGDYEDKDDFENDFGFAIDTKIAWRYHLQKMVLGKPLKYLEKFLDENK